MKIKFEEWLEENIQDKEARLLFEESVVCYKASAYRASLLFSFLGFQTIVKHRVINSQSAEDFADGEWLQLKKDLGNDDKWDKTIIELLQNKKKTAFKISEDVREQYMYWKNRRNDCAHAKGNEISYPHVEGFWLFIQSNLNKFVVNGGMEFILQEVRDHYDPIITPVETPIIPIVNKIPMSIEAKDFQDFLERLKKITLDPVSRGLHMRLDEGKVWFDMFSLPSPYDDLYVDFLEKEINVTMAMLRARPNLVKYLHSRDKLIRRLWMGEFGARVDYRVFIEMLRNSLIPENQLPDAINHMLENVESDIFSDISNYWLEDHVDAMDRHVLIEEGFFDKFKEIAFDNLEITQFNWANRNRYIVLHYIEHFPIDAKVMFSVERVLTGSYPPFKLRDALIEFYKDNQNKLEELIDFCEREGDGVPKEITELRISS